MSLGLGIGDGRQFFDGSKNAGNLFLHIVVVFEISIRFLYPCVLMIHIGSLTKSYPLFYQVLCAVSISVLCGGKCGIVIPVVQGNSGIREVCCSGYVGIGRINRLFKFLVDISFCFGLSTVCVAARSTYLLRRIAFYWSLTFSLLNSRGSHICVYGGFIVIKTGFSGGKIGNCVDQIRDFIRLSGAYGFRLYCCN
ncbi:MAG: hypothetical protein EZS28_011875 [Streblomastix strix]|uniref:Uncharacterized protein n=1 Tax=Streblomastix strix TaxID=222440 RepID=A0A5J4WCC5_9EUKA|nr:MAG: hypothetical protein EZS28_011875 [Streblomastix strix]